MIRQRRILHVFFVLLVPVHTYLPGACIPCSSASNRWRVYEAEAEVEKGEARCSQMPSMLRHLKSWKRPLRIRLGIRPAVTAARQMLACASIVTPKKEHSKAQQSRQRLHLISKQTRLLSKWLTVSLPTHSGSTSSTSAKRKQKARLEKTLRHCPGTVSNVDSQDAGRVALACHC